MFFNIKRNKYQVKNVHSLSLITMMFFIPSLMSWFFEILLPREIFIKHQSDSVTLSRKDIGYGGKASLTSTAMF